MWRAIQLDLECLMAERLSIHEQILAAETRVARQVDPELPQARLVSRGRESPPVA